MRTRQARNGTRGLAAGALLLLLVLPGPALPASPGIEKEPEVDFARLLHLAELYDSILFSRLGEVQARWHGVYEGMSVVDIESTETRYFVGSEVGKKHQVVMIRGTANLTNLRLDFAVDPHLNDRLGILLHRGFEKTALSIYADLPTYLDRESALTLSGTSLGGAAALILAMLLSQDGYRVREVVTFGQPKVTDSQGARKFAYLPLLRIVDRHDLVPRLPPPSFEDPALQGFRHLGPEVLLLDCEYYCYVSEAQANSAEMNSYWKGWKGGDAITSLIDHVIYSYLDRLRPKTDGAIRVPFEQHAQYENIHCGK